MWDLSLIEEVIQGVSRLEIRELRVGNIIIPNNVLMAPLAGYSCYPFRVMCGELGAGLCFTEMVNCNSLRYKDRATQRLLLTGEKERIKAVQLVGSDPKILERIAKGDFVKKFDIIDINMGCPVPNVVKSGQGCSLLGDLKRASAIIKGCKRSGKVVTVKTRVGLREDLLIAAEFARMCEDAGADMLTFHGRSRDMMYHGTPFFSEIEQAKSVVNIPVIANGGIFSKEDAEQMMNSTGADGIMIGRYALENPFIFAEILGKRVEKSRAELLSEQVDLALNHYDEIYALAYVKKVASYWLKGTKKGRENKLELYSCGNTTELKEAIKTVFGREC